MANATTAAEERTVPMPVVTSAYEAASTAMAVHLSSSVFHNDRQAVALRRALKATFNGQGWHKVRDASRIKKTKVPDTLMTETAAAECRLKFIVLAQNISAFLSKADSIIAAHKGKEEGDEDEEIPLKTKGMPAYTAEQATSFWDDNIPANVVKPKSFM